MYCKYCGKEISENAKFCECCGKPVLKEYAPVQQKVEVHRCPKCGDAVSQYAQMCRNCGTNLSVSNPRTNKRNCPKCKSCNIEYQTVTESRGTGCFTVLLYILLACTILGLLIVIPLALRKKTETITYAVCQDCGHKWKI